MIYAFCTPKALERNVQDFRQALAMHCKNKGHKYRYLVFPEPAYFSGATFDSEADFYGATFTVWADFSNATFNKRANFLGAKFYATAAANFTDVKFNDDVDFGNAKFCDGARFSQAKFTGWADFSGGKFTKQVDFSGAEFKGPVEFCVRSFYEAKFEDTRFAREADFFCATFTARANFFRARFAEGADFSGVKFARDKEVVFRGTRFLGVTLFASTEEDGDPAEIFSKADVDFSEVIIAPLDALIFRNADLQKCRFLNADLRKAEFTHVKWHEKWGHLRVYDQEVAEQKHEKDKWSHIEQLYRQLKQNYEDRRDYEHARHFHYGEKEMRRRNSRWGLWILLSVYRCVSGYGESALCPFLWAVVLLATSSAAYLCGSLLHVNKDASSILDPTSMRDVGLYSLRVMTLLRPNDFMPNGFWGNFVNMLQSIFGPLLFALFALALRQRLKR